MDTVLRGRAGVLECGGVLVDVSEGAARTAALRAWPGMHTWDCGCARESGDLLVSLRMCT